MDSDPETNENRSYGAAQSAASACTICPNPLHNLPGGGASEIQHGSQVVGLRTRDGITHVVCSKSCGMSIANFGFWVRICRGNRKEPYLKDMVTQTSLPRSSVSQDITKLSESVNHFEEGTLDKNGRYYLSANPNPVYINQKWSYETFMESVNIFSDGGIGLTSPRMTYNSTTIPQQSVYPAIGQSTFESSRGTDESPDTSNTGANNLFVANEQTLRDIWSDGYQTPVQTDNGGLLDLGYQAPSDH